MAQVVNRRPFNAEAGFRSQVCPCEICGGQRGAGTGLCPSISVPSPPICIVSAKFHTHLFTYHRRRVNSTTGNDVNPYPANVENRVSS